MNKRWLGYWKRIRDHALKKMRKYSGGATRCPNCLRWSYEKDEPIWTIPDESKLHNYHMTCTSCGYVSEWFDTGFMGMMGLVDKNQPALDRLERIGIYPDGKEKQK